jgi:Uncharacterized protein conserved in bacteria
MRASRFVAWITGFAAALVLTPVDRAATQASNFPNHPIKIIIGPSPDIFSRIVAEHLQQTWGQPVVVEPRPGAGGSLRSQRYRPPRRMAIRCCLPHRPTHSTPR